MTTESDTRIAVKEGQPPQSVLDSQSEYPEGGLAGWATVVGA
jgi:hypothetical protein